MEEQKQGWGLDTNEHLFSPAYVYNQCCGGKNNGMSISQAMELIIDQGVCTLESFPYKASITARSLRRSSGRKRQIIKPAAGLP